MPVRFFHSDSVYRHSRDRLWRIASNWYRVFRIRPKGSVSSKKEMKWRIASFLRFPKPIAKCRFCVAWPSWRYCFSGSTYKARKPIAWWSDLHNCIGAMGYRRQYCRGCFWMPLSSGADTRSWCRRGRNDVWTGFLAYTICSSSLRPIWPSRTRVVAGSRYWWWNRWWPSYVAGMRYWQKEKETWGKRHPILHSIRDSYWKEVHPNRR